MNSNTKHAGRSEGAILQGPARNRMAWLSALPVVFATLLLALPILALIYLSVANTGQVWEHLLANVLPRSSATTLMLMAGVGIGTAIIGVGTAWLTSAFSFPGVRLFRWALVLPLAVPIYINAYAYIELFDYSGPVQTFVRQTFGYSNPREYWFPEIRTLPGAIFLMSMVLFPYVYLTTRMVFLMQGASILEVSRALGAGPMRQFWKIALPLARPAIVVGVTLALMETLNDIGAVEVLGVQTLTFSVYDTWLNRNSLAGAAQIAFIMLAIIVALIWLERVARGRGRFAASGKSDPLSPTRLSNWRRWVATLLCALPIIFGFVLPLWVLAGFASRRFEQLMEPALLRAIGNSTLVALLTAIVAVFIAFFLVYAARVSSRQRIAALGRLSALGYAVPGTVLAIGVLIPFAGFDNWFDGLMTNWFGISTGLLFSGTIVIIIYACTVRFMAMAHGTLESGFAKISPHIDMAARTLGRTNFQTLRQVHVPIMGKAIAAAGLLVFVETMKELSATILLRPFNFNTLATYLYEYASEGEFERAAMPSLLIVLVGIVPVILLTRISVNRTTLR